jgi:hypothetical protein
MQLLRISGGSAYGMFYGRRDGTSLPRTSPAVPGRWRLLWRGFRWGRNGQCWQQSEEESVMPKTSDMATPGLKDLRSDVGVNGDIVSWPARSRGSIIRRRWSTERHLYHLVPPTRCSARSAANRTAPSSSDDSDDVSTRC